MTVSIKAKGKPVVITAVCSVDNARSPPISKRIAATNPSIQAQNILCGTGESNFPPDVILSTTSDPESLEVIKNEITSKVPKIDRMTLINPDITGISNRLINSNRAIGKLSCTKSNS